MGLDSDDNLSNLSGYSSSGSNNAMQFLSSLRQGQQSLTNLIEEGESSTAEDTEVSQAQTSVM